MRMALRDGTMAAQSATSHAWISGVHVLTSLLRLPSPHRTVAASDECESSYAYLRPRCSNVSQKTSVVHFCSYGVALHDGTSKRRARAICCGVGCDYSSRPDA